jgi:hypothetical protein
MVQRKRRGAPRSQARRPSRLPLAAEQPLKNRKELRSEGNSTAGSRNLGISSNYAGSRQVAEFDYRCPVCGRSNGNARRKPNHYGIEEWFVSCWTPECEGLGRGYLRALADETKALNGSDIKDDPWRWLRHLSSGGQSSRNGEPEELPSEAKLVGWHDRLLANRRAYRYLTKRRGLTPETIEHHQIGYGEFHGRPPAFIFPVWDSAGRLLTLKERFWPELWKGHKSRTLTGRPAALYPVVPDGRAVILVEGEIDALQLVQRSLPAVTATCGATLPHALAPELADRRVAVMYDVGADQAAARTVAHLRDVGAEAFVVRLPMRRKGADVSDYFARGRTAEALIARVRARRPA